MLFRSSRAATLHVGSDALERANANEQLGLTLIAQVIRPTRPEARGPSPEEQLTEAIKQARLSYGTMPYTLTGLTGLAREANDRLALGLPETVIKRAARDEINDATMKQVIHNNGKGYYTNIN